MRTALTMILAATLAAAMASPSLAKRRIDLRESDPYFGPTSVLVVNPEQVVIYGSQQGDEPLTAFERQRLNAERKEHNDK